MPALARHHAARLAEPDQALHHRLLTDHLAGLVAPAEGRDITGPALERVGTAGAAPAAERPESPVAARLRAFGSNGHEARTITR